MFEDYTEELFKLVLSNKNEIFEGVDEEYRCIIKKNIYNDLGNLCF
jgi:hypothetical protein